MIFRTKQARLLSTVSKGFTLLETLVVVGIITIILVLTAPSMTGVIQAMKVTEGGDLLMGFFSEAQEIANTMGRPVEVRLYSKNSALVPNAGYSVMTLEYYQVGENDPRLGEGSTGIALAAPLAAQVRPMTNLPAGIAMHPDPSLSTLLSSESLLPNDANQGGQDVQTVAKSGTSFVNYEAPDLPYHKFSFLPNGTSLNSAAGNKWFVTVVAENDLSKDSQVLRNFYTIQIDPITGRLSRYRP